MNPKYAPLDTWQKDCEICNVGLCNRIDGLKDEGKSIREAARIMESESDGLWDAEKIRARYLYYKGGRKPTREKNTPKTAPVPTVNPAAELNTKPATKNNSPKLTPRKEKLQKEFEQIESDIMHAVFQKVFGIRGIVHEMRVGDEIVAGKSYSSKSIGKGNIIEVYVIVEKKKGT